MWQRFTERARKVVFYSQEEAQKNGDGYVSTEHLLLGLLRESGTVAARVIERLGFSVNQVRMEVEKQLPRGEVREHQDMTLTPRAKRIIDLSYDEARLLNNNYIGTEHLLLGLIREGDGLGGRVLISLGFDLEQARVEVKALQDAEPPRDSPPSARLVSPLSSEDSRFLSTLRQLVTEGDPAVLDDPATLRSVLLERCPSEDKAANLIFLAALAGAYGELSAGLEDRRAREAILAKRLREEFSVAAWGADWAIWAWAYALRAD